MPTRSMSMERMERRQLLDGPLLVGQAVVAEVAVAEVVVPLRARRVAAAVADLDDDEAELGQATLALRGTNVLETLSVCGPG